MLFFGGGGSLPEIANCQPFCLWKSRSPAFLWAETLKPRGSSHRNRKNKALTHGGWFGQRGELPGSEHREGRHQGQAILSGHLEALLPPELPLQTAIKCARLLQKPLESFLVPALIVVPL